MKKWLVLSLVLSAVSMAPAAMTSGLLTIDAPAVAVEGTQFDVIVSGGAGEAYNAGLYEPNYDASGIPDSVQVLDAAGNLGGAVIFPSYGGFDFIVDDLGHFYPEGGNGVQAGDWIIATYTAGTAGDSLVLDLYDYAVSYDTPAIPSVAIIAFIGDIIYPEPYFNISPQSLSFSAYEAGVNPNNKDLSITNSGQQSLNWSVSDPNLLPDWLSVAPTNGILVYGQNEIVTVSVDTTGLDAGLYSYAFEVADPNALNSPQMITVDLEVIGPILYVSNTVFDFTAYLDGTNPDDQTMSVYNIGGGTLNWSADIADMPSWLTINPASGDLVHGVTSDDIFGDTATLSVDIAGLDDGHYSYAFQVADPNAEGSPQTVTVNLEVIGPILDVSNTEFFGPAYLDGPNPDDRILTISNPGGGTVNWEIDTTGLPSWLSLSSTSGGLGHDASDELILSIDITGLSAGNYYYLFDVADPSAENSPQTITVSLDVIGPILNVSSAVFNFAATPGGPDPASQVLTVSNPGGGILNWSTGTTGIPSWLSISPTSGSLGHTFSDAITLSVGIAGLSEGIYTYTFDIAAPNADGSPAAIQVQLSYVSCYTGPDFDEWVAVGRPDSWCDPSQSQGDADGANEAIGKGVFTVGFNDLDILLEGFYKPYSGDPLVDPWIAADFDHASEKIGKEFYRVGFNDLDIWLANFQTPISP